MKSQSFPTCLTCTRAFAADLVQEPNLIPWALLYNRTREILNLKSQIREIADSPPKTCTEPGHHDKRSCLIFARQHMARFIYSVQRFSCDLAAQGGDGPSIRMPSKEGGQAVVRSASQHS